MSDGIEYRSFASKCLHFAEDSEDANLTNLLIEMALVWRKLADVADGIKHPLDYIKPAK